MDIWPYVQICQLADMHASQNMDSESNSDHIFVYLHPYSLTMEGDLLYMTYDTLAQMDPRFCYM